MNKHKLSYWLFLVVITLGASNISCSPDPDQESPLFVIPNPDDDDDLVFDEANSVYKSYTGLVMAGYQGWFAAEGDDSNRGWHHYTNSECGGFTNSCSSIDMWPDMSEYQKKYITPYKNADGSDTYLYSPYDEESVDVHFKWMKDHGIDGVHMQRFLSEVISNPSGKRHFDKVLANALKAAKKYGRAISVMYDLSGSTSDRVAALETDWNELVRTFKLNNNIENPTYLWHNGKPMMSIWGVGFSDGNREYTTEDVNQLVDKLKGPDDKVSIMLGVPYRWRTLTNDAENNPALHDLIRKVDVIMPWAVGRYNSPSSYNPSYVAQDVVWANDNGVDYVPLVFPGFSWGNLQRDPSQFNKIPRLKGEFLWKQVSGAKAGGAKSLYVAMFDEVDEGTAIFKVKRENEVPVVEGVDGYEFIGIEDGLESDYYLWLTGQAANWFHGDSGYSNTKPIR